MSNLNNNPSNNLSPEEAAARKSLTVLFLSPTHQYQAVQSDQLVLHQIEINQIALGIPTLDREGKPAFQVFVLFPGKLVLEEKKIELVS